MPTPKGGETMELELLEEIGLTKSEVKVYLSLLELGSSTTGPIVDKSRASSSKIYEILEKLIQKGLVSFVIKSGTKHFEAADPNRILDYIEEKKNKLEEQEQGLKKIIPQLELKQKLSEYNSEATIYKGIKGMKTAFNDVLKTMKRGEEYHVLVGMDAKEPIFSFINHYHQRRANAGIKVKLLYSPNSVKFANAIEMVPHTTVKVAPYQLLSSSFILIYKNKTLISILERNDLTIFRLDSKQTAKSFKTTFDLLWNQDTRIIKGLDAVQELFEEMLDSGGVDLIGARGYFVDQRPDFIDDWEKRAIKKKFKMRNVVDIGTKGHRITQFPFAETRYNIPKEFATLSVFWIIKDKVAISNWVEKEPVVLIIENRNLAQIYKKQFKLLWGEK
jgi:HTH-type transcriptional regulator, sugar sensing transcriptional regulator